MILLDTDTLTLHQAGHLKVTERIRNASEVPRITLVTQIEALRGRYDAVLKAEDGANALWSAVLCTAFFCFPKKESGGDRRTPKSALPSGPQEWTHITAMR